MHHDRLGSAIQVLDETGTQAMRLGYSPFGQVYRKHSDKTQWKINAGVNANKQLGQLMPYQYTGGYTDGNTGLVHLDARWYNPYISRFVQPDYWNFKNTYLPTEIQHELMRFTGLNANQLLRDPSQQLAHGYVSGNPLSWVDLLGLSEFYGFSIHDDYDYGTGPKYDAMQLTLTPDRQIELRGIYRSIGSDFTTAGLLASIHPYTLPASAPLLAVGQTAEALGSLLGDNKAKDIAIELAKAKIPDGIIDPISTIAKGTNAISKENTWFDSLKEWAKDSIGSLFDDDC
ncbi:hypothetical protein KP803_11905 [Vibrio sp. ZSDE26]|uniref:Teneurin-like YD-shell domain-containing protein n=1 Tax=Vibrio amylolyticus TaxID=2847292 RepID=A0A9X2BHJ8_9VIBR|nr:RHS repeat-associated core domain-containing protein [Vibrio amylolyticus]MCK6263974.1 hypothetical protein [Vibrio amylolyticus]